MKIGIDISTLQDRYYSGVSEYSFNVIKHIIAGDKDNEYVLYLNRFRAFDALKFNFSDYPKVSFFQTRYPSRLFNYIFQKIFRFPKIDKLIGGVDVFYSPHLNFLALSRDCRKIMTVHDISFLRYRNFFSMRKNFWHRILNVKKLLNRQDAIIAVSENTKQDIIELCGVPAEKIKVIYCGIEDNLRPMGEADLKANALALKQESGVELPDDYILYLGTIEPRKNIIGLMQAYEELLRKNPKQKKYRLLLAGAIGWKSRDILRYREKSEFADRIVFLDYVNAKFKNLLYSRAALFVFPSFYEGFGFPPLEAAAVGTPVLIAGNSSLSEVSGKYFLCIDPHDIAAMSESIDYLLSQVKNKKKTLTVSDELRRKYSWRESAKKHRNMICETDLEKI